MPVDPRLERLLQTVEPRGVVLGSWSLKGGISAEMTAFEAKLPSGLTKKMIVRRPSERTLRQNPLAAEHEFRLLQKMNASGLTSPAPYSLDSSCAIFPTPCLLLEYIEGSPKFTTANLESFTLQCATHLARIHRVEAPGAELSFLSQTPAALGGRPGLLDASLDEGRLLDALEAAWPPRLSNPTSLLHGDFWPGNLLWSEERLVAVIDWEDARLGDPLSDLSIARLDMLCIFGLEAMDAFTRHYRSLVLLDAESLPLWDLWAALRLIRMASADLAGWAAFFHPFGRRDITESSLRQAHRLFVEQALKALA